MKLLIVAQAVTSLIGSPEADAAVYVGGSGLIGAQAFACAPLAQSSFKETGGFVQLDGSGNELVLVVNDRFLPVEVDLQGWPVLSSVPLRWKAPIYDTEGLPVVLEGFVLRYPGAEVQLPPEARDYIVVNLPPGTWPFSLSAVDAQGEGEATTVVERIE